MVPSEYNPVRRHEQHHQNAKEETQLIYVLSDPHGLYDKYRTMLNTIQLKSTDTLYVLGDVIDRGPDGLAILQDMMGRPNVIPILGNHEFTAAICIPWLLKEVTDQSLNALGNVQIAALSDWINNGGGPTLRALKQLSQDEREDILDYIKEMELYAEVEAGGHSYVLVHAGLDHFSPGKPLSEYELQDFLFCCNSMNTAYYADKFLVFGHTPTSLLRQQAGAPPTDRILRWGTQIAIDCGCAFGGPLGAICLDTQEEFYVK